MCVEMDFTRTFQAPTNCNAIIEVVFEVIRFW